MFLMLAPVGVWLYVRLRQRRQSLSAGFGAAGRQADRPTAAAAWLGRLPALLFLSGMLILLVALARPQAEVFIPRVEGTVMLVFDVSGSMAADDVQPSRLEAARRAAREFIAGQPSTVRVGLVAFSGSGFAVQQPTDDANRLLQAIDRLEPQNGTSLAQGILVALNTLANDAGLTPAAGAAQGQAQASPDAESRPPGDELLEQLPPGPYPPAVIVILSDGENNAPPDPDQAAAAAAERGVRIDALGFGTPAGAILDVDGFRVHTMLDEPALQRITSLAGGSYYNPQTAPDPQSVYANLVPRLVVKPEKMEITSIFTGAGLLALLLGGLFSILWFHRLP
jgi:Ca-activated chloride channel family protein